MYNDTDYDNGVYKTVVERYSYMYKLNYSIGYDGTDDCSASRAQSVEYSNHTLGVCTSAFENYDDFYYTTDHTYSMVTVTSSDQSGMC